MSLYATVSSWIKETPDHLKTLEMCNEVMYIIPAAFFLIPDLFKTKEMCKKVVQEDP